LRADVEGACAAAEVLRGRLADAEESLAQVKRERDRAREDREEAMASLDVLREELTEAGAGYGEPVAWFHTRGGAPVLLYHHRFVTRFDYRGAPYAAEMPYEVDGFQWRCLGCGTYGHEGDTYRDDGYRRLVEAREAANEHAAGCWSAEKALPAVGLASVEAEAK